MQKLNIDVHSHWIPEKYIELAARGDFGDLVSITDNPDGRVLEAGSKTLGQPLRSALTPQLVDVDVQVADMKKAGLDCAVVSMQPFTFHYEGESKLVESIHKLLNDELALFINKYPGEIYGLANVPLQNVEAAIAELKRVMAMPGMVGVQLGSNVNGAYLGEKEFFPFFEKAQELGALVLIHPMNVAAYDRSKKFYFRNLVGNPLDSTISAGSLIFEGVMDKLPNLKICLCHAGGYLPYAIGRFDHGYKVRKETKTIPNPPSHYFKNFYYDIITHSSEALAYLVKTVGADRVVIGTDYPFDMGLLDPLSALDEIALTKKERSLICHENAIRLIKKK